MGTLFSCCSSVHEGERDPLFDSQLGYDSLRIANENKLALEQELQQRLLQRQQELTDIAKNTNDKLIDISMISNSGIVIQSHDLDEHECMNPSKNKLQSLNPECLSEEMRMNMKKLHNELFGRLEQSFRLESSDPLVVAL